MRKVWMMVDTDASEVIDQRELGQLMSALNGGTPVAVDEVARVREMVDTDGDGVITYAEFLEAMGNWLGSTRKRTFEGDSSDDEGGSPVSRKRLHKDISTFFTRFARRPDVGEIVSAEVHASDFDVFDERSILTPLAYDKTAYVEECRLRGTHGGMEELRGQIVNEDPDTVLAGVSHLAEVLRVVEILPTASQRFALRDELIALWQQMINFNLPGELALLCRPKLQVANVAVKNAIHAKAMEALYQFVLGPRLPHQTIDSPYHPSNVYEATTLPLYRHTGIVHFACDLLAMPDRDAQVIDAAFRLLAAIGREHDDVWEYLVVSKSLMAGVVSMLSDCIAQQSTVGLPASALEESMLLMESGSLLMAVLVGFTHVEKVTDEKVFEAVRGTDVLNVCWQFLEADFEALKVRGLFLMSHLCLALNRLLPWVQAEESLVVRMLFMADRLTAASAPKGDDAAAVKQARVRAAVPAMSCVRRLMLLGDVDWTKRLVEGTNLLDVVKRLFADATPEAHPLRMTGCRVLAALVGAKLGLFKEVIAKSGLVSSMLATMSADDVLRKRCVAIVHQLATAVHILPDQLEALGAAGVVSALFRNLSFFKQRDSVLSEAYDWRDATYNFHTVISSLKALAVLIDTHGTIINLYGLEELDKFEALVRVLGTELRKPELRAAEHAAGVSGQIEDASLLLLRAMHTRHSEMAATSATSARIVSELDEAISRVESLMASRAALGALPGYLHIHVILGKQRRIIEALPSVSLAQLRGRVSERFGMPLARVPRLFCKDEAGAPFELTTDETLLRAVTASATLGEMALQITDNPTGIAGRGPGAYGDAGMGGAGGGGGGGAGLAAIRREQLEQLRFNFPDNHIQTFINSNFDAVFEAFKNDANADGEITFKQFQRRLREMGVGGPPEVFSAIFNAFDGDRSGTIHFQELMVGLAAMQPDAPIEEKCRMAFRAFDQPPHDGVLDENEITQLIRVAAGPQGGGGLLTDSVARAEARQLIADWDSDGDGYLDETEFARAALENRYLLDVFGF